MPVQLTPYLDQRTNSAGREGPYFRQFQEVSRGLRLIPVRSRLQWTGADLPPGRYTVGSGPDCDVIIEETGVAARHCTIVVGDRQTILKAWSPRTWVNDGVVQEAALRPGDRLILGPIEIKIETLPPPAIPEPSRNAPALEDLRELLSQDLNRKANLSTGSIPAQRRQQLLEELLQEVQFTLGEVIEREKVMRHSLEHEKQRLTRRGEELTHQFELLESARSREQKRQSSAAELAKWQETLQSRHSELAHRCSELIRLRRQQKKTLLDLEMRESVVTQREASFQTRETELRNLAARNDAQKRQLRSRTQDLDRREDVIRMQQVVCSDRQEALDARIAAAEEEQAHWLQKCRSRERLIDELDKSIQSRISDIEQEEDRLRRCLSQYEENRQALNQSVADLEKTREELDARSEKLLQDEQRLAELSAHLESERQQLETDRNDLEQSRTEFAEQSRLIQQEQVAATQAELEHLQAREQALTQREQELLTTEKEWISREEAVHDQLQTLSRHREELRTKEAELAALQQSLVEREAVLKESSLDLERQNAEAANALAEIHDQQSALEAERGRLQQQQAELVETQAELTARQEATDRAYADLKSHRLANEEQARKLTAQLGDLIARESALNNREQELADLEAQLQKQAEELAEAPAAQVETQAAALMPAELLPAESNPNQSEMIQEQVAALERQREEIEQARAGLEQSIEAFEIRQANFDAASQNLSLLRSELEAERQRDSYDREQLAQQRTQLQRALIELEDKRNELAALEDSLLQKQNEWEFQHQSRLAELSHDSAETESTSLTSSTQEQAHRVEVEDLHDEIESLQRENERLHQRLSELMTERKDYLFTSKNAGETEAAVPSVRGSTGQAIEELRMAQFPIPFPVADLESSDRADVEMESVSPPIQEDAAALKLRNELANLFGFRADELTEEHHQESPVHVSLADEHSVDIPNVQRAEPRAANETIAPKEAVTVSESNVVLDENGEETVESYMQRLLARQRDKSSSDEPVRYKLPVAPAASAPVQEADSLPEVTDDVKRPEVIGAIRKDRKLKEEDKESIRANVNSFRELANYSTRSAVAASKAVRTTNIVRTMLMLSAFGWVATAALVFVFLKVDKGFLMETVFVGGLTSLMTLLALIRYWEVRQISSVPAPLPEPVEVPRPVSPANSSSDDKSPLSFL